MLDDATTVKTAFVRSGHWLGNPTEQLTAALQVPSGGCVRLPLMKSRHTTMQMDSSRTNARVSVHGTASDVSTSSCCVFIVVFT